LEERQAELLLVKMKEMLIIPVVWTHSGDRLDYRVKVELKVLYTGGRGGATYPY
jgi:hypothetical protein